MANRCALLLITAALSLLVLPALAQEGFMDAGQPDPSTIAKYAKKPGYSPYAGLTYPSHVYWGRTSTCTLHGPLTQACRAPRSRLETPCALRVERR